MPATSRRTTKGGTLTPPLVGLGHLRVAHGYTLDEVADGVAAITGKSRPNPGTISGVELGHRKPSEDLLAALIEFYELDSKPHVYPRPRLIPTPSKSVAA
jgi:transcriptional regulator with XRE-family HTH domain